MSRSVFFVFVCFLQYVYGFNQCASNKTELSCTTEILGQNSTNYDYCKMKVYPSDSQECGAMKFKSVSDNVNWNIGGVTLKPHIVRLVNYDNVIPFEMNRTVLNISFTNIKWKTMKFRFQDKNRNAKNHCRNIMISNDFTVDDQSVLYYDCYWPKSDDKEGQSHMLDFEATAEDKSVNRGQYYFNIPSAEMLSPTTTEERWKPFIYVEILEGRLRVHIMPPPCQLKITAYRFKVITTCGEEAPCSVKTTTLMLKHADEVTYDYNYVGVNGNVTFVVIPLHARCKDDTEPGCQAVKSPIIKISSDQMLNICIASITALIVATLFAYYIVLRVIRRYCCQERPPDRGRGAKIPRSPTVLIIYPTHNRAHVDCVGAFAYYLRNELGFEVLHDGDIAMTIHGDPYTWALEAFRQAEVVMYVVGPAVADTNINTYDKPIINAHKNIDTLLLSFLKANRASKHPKDVITVYFEHSNGPVPPETQPTVASFKILKDCNKLVAYLSRNMIPRVHMMLTPRGRFFVEELKKAGKVFGAKDEILVQYDNATSAEKRILLYRSLAHYLQTRKQAQNLYHTLNNRDLRV